MAVASYLQPIEVILVSCPGGGASHTARTQPTQQPADVRGGRPRCAIPNGISAGCSTVARMQTVHARALPAHRDSLVS